ncbi:MAG: hypothetical protein M1820_000039 [Bogoriella megaspora]|nr:MAG: hypothetical protein M1820_000039 [Bogoriella megaspora]
MFFSRRGADGGLIAVLLFMIGSLYYLQTLRSQMYHNLEKAMKAISTPATPLNTTYLPSARAAAAELKKHFYAPSSGLMKNQDPKSDGILWWESANELTALTNLAIVDPSYKPTAKKFLHTAFTKARGLKGASNFKNDYYDDEGWWAMLWIAAYDLTKEDKYLKIAEDIFDDMANGWESLCGGGIWWDKARTYVASISNEIFFKVASQLANRAPRNEEGRSRYLHWALREWHWFSTKIHISNQGNEMDGINKAGCTDNKRVFSYNQGVILGGLIELEEATRNGTLIQRAHTIANAAIDHLTIDGILAERDPKTDAQFKGIFVRNLMKLQFISPKDKYMTFLTQNADSVLKSDFKEGMIGPHWQGPYRKATAQSQGSGLDLLVAAAAVSFLPNYNTH